MDLYHVLNRGVEGRTIFRSSGDYIRFVHGLYAFNDARPANNTTRSLDTNMNDLGGRSLERERLVDIHGWCIMKNHYHLLLSDLQEEGISKFIMKINVGYAKYFNEKYGHKGYVFQGRTKKILIERDAHYMHILNYIHLNPLDYLKGATEWRKRELASPKRAEEYLATYRWSSYLDYTGTPNFPSVLTTTEFDDPVVSYAKDVQRYLRHIETSSITDLILE